jgi:Chemoreceptor zinc-binding domain
MNFDEAAKKHAEWKTKFRAAIAKKEQLDAATICVDSKCDLGKWLHSQNKSALAANTNFQACLNHHAKFHKEAGNVAKLINAGKYTDAEAALGGATAYGAASNAVIMALQSLKKEVA